MKRDIDDIITALREKLPEVRVVQMSKIHSADDDGLWWFRLPGMKKDIQIESPTGNCPFILENDDITSSSEAINAGTVTEVVSIVFDYLKNLQRPSTAAI